MSALTTAEPCTLAECEEVIEAGMQTFIEVGGALIKIRDGRLYKDKGYSAFAEYCEERWSFSRVRAHQLIDAAQVAGNLLTTVNTSPAEPTGILCPNCDKRFAAASGHACAKTGAFVDPVIPKSERQVRPLAQLEPEQQKAAWSAAVESADGEQPTVRQVEAAVERVSKPRASITIPVAESSEHFVTDLDGLSNAGRKFSCIYADPPWQYSNQSTRGSTDNHYSTLTIDQLCALPVGELAEDRCHLHLWITNGFLFEAPKIFAAWGFEFKSSFVWVKPQIGMGNYWRNSHELLLLAVRGGMTAADKSQRSWQEKPRTAHSEKPDDIRTAVSMISPGPYLELFGRKPVEGWTVFGNEVMK